MLEKIDLSRKISKTEYKDKMPVLRNHLYALQKASWDARIPVIIVLEGWDASGKGTSVRALTERLDPVWLQAPPHPRRPDFREKAPLVMAVLAENPSLR